jgi:hypothetical protein
MHNPTLCVPFDGGTDLGQNVADNGFHLRAAFAPVGSPARRGSTGPPLSSAVAVLCYSIMISYRRERPRASAKCEQGEI